MGLSSQELELLSKIEQGDFEGAKALLNLDKREEIKKELTTFYRCTGPLPGETEFPEGMKEIRENLLTFIKML